METENSIQNNALMLQAIEELHQTADFSLVKADLLAMYENALKSDTFALQPNEHFERFHSFKCLYNFLTVIAMHKDSECTGVNLLA